MKPKIPHDVIDEALVCPDCHSHIQLEEYWVGDESDPENWKLIGLICPQCCEVFELVDTDADEDAEDIPF